MKYSVERVEASPPPERAGLGSRQPTEIAAHVLSLVQSARRPYKESR